MSLFEDNSKDKLIDIANTIDQVGYKSLLLVYDSFLDNAVVNVANTINKEHTFKYIIAIRTYSLSPEYLATIYETFEKIAPGRITFNIIPGNLKFQETSVRDVVFIEDKIKTIDQRNEYTIEWLKKYQRLSLLKRLPPVMLSGDTVDFQKVCLEYGMTNIMKLGDFLNQYNNGLIKNKNQIVSIAILNTDKVDKENKYINQLLETHKDTTIYGNKEEIVKQLIDLKSKGVSDVLVHQLPSGNKSSDIHEIIKELVSMPSYF
jgi:alkanesulfonate monooxygenase SsuD/methylene tetrahydromethanopterin reductase-like flavin-dependent oxidoreductase (luciferase family)